MEKPDFRLELADELPSTSQELFRRHEAGENIHGLFLGAKKQTQGVGRRGRTWLTASGNVAVSLGLRGSAQDPWAWLPLWAGIALFDTAANFLPAAAAEALTLKWPNDLCHKGLKLSGLLSQVRQQGERTVAALGIGFNLKEAPTGPGISAVSLAGIQKSAGFAAGAPTLEVFLEALLQRLEAYWGLWRDTARLKEEWEKRARFLKEEIRFGQLEDPAGMQQGVALGLGPLGELRVQTAKGEILLASEDISLRF